ncbi:MAG: DoxX family protein [Gemmatimonadales bacterium]
MQWIVLASQVIVALGLLNVWLLRAGKSTAWRGSGAKNMSEEFAVYGLPAWSVSVVGFLKVALAVALIIGIWLPSVTKPAATGVVVLMLGAVAMHFKVGDPLRKALPALALLVLSLLIILL